MNTPMPILIHAFVDIPLCIFRYIFMRVPVDIPIHAFVDIPVDIDAAGTGGGKVRCDSGMNPV